MKIEKNNYALDAMKSNNGDNLATTFFTEIRHIGIGNISGPFLGLGAGKGKAEISLAQKLELPDITLVDKDGEDIPGFQGRYLEQDIFEYMQTTPHRYGVVTAFSLEYFLDTQRVWALFWEGIDRVTRPGSIILIAPYDTPRYINESQYSIKRSNQGFIAQRI